MQELMLDTFCLLGVRVLSDDSIGKRKLHSNYLYKFYKGFDVQEDELSLSHTFVANQNLYSNFFGTLDSRPRVAISAIVGANGAGKSTIVEFLLRLQNNLSVALLGDEVRNKKSKRHLCYIDGVRGELYYLQHGYIYQLYVWDDYVKLYEWRPRAVHAHEDKLVFENQAPVFQREIINGKAVSSKDELAHGLAYQLFYSLVVNNSIYAYNPNDYAGECNWFDGVFHKSDGYQIPLLLTPDRTNGNIDINVENSLARERFIKLLVTQRNDEWKINDHLSVVAIETRLKDKVYDYKYIKKNTAFYALYKRGYDALRKQVVTCWSEEVQEDLTKYAEVREYYEKAIDYLVYKTMRIASQYKEHHKFADAYAKMRTSFRKDDITKLVHNLASDYSHKTEKVRQLLGYLLWGVHDGKNRGSISLTEIAKIKEKIDVPDNRHNRLYFETMKESLMPPPFMETKVVMKDGVSGNRVDFATLSSGEKQQIYAISSVLYHLMNLNSIKEDKSFANPICYEHVVILLEEIELYYHPELQKNLIRFILEQIKQLWLPNIKSVSLHLVTHSPFVLSDLPSDNILALEKGGQCSKIVPTFAANIHDLIRDSFFIQDGAIGMYARWYINKIIECLKEKEEGSKDYKYEDIIIMIQRIDEPILRHALMQRADKIYGADANIEMQIQRLNKEIERLQAKKEK